MQSCFVLLVAIICVSGISAYFPDESENRAGLKFAKRLAKDTILLEKYIRCLLDVVRKPICEDPGMRFCIGK